MMAEFREAFPDLNFWGVGDLIAEGGRLRRWPLGWRGYAHGTGIPGSSRWISPGQVRTKDEVHRHNSLEDRERQDR